MIPTQDTAVVVLVNGGSGVGFQETSKLRNAITAQALGLDYDGEGSRMQQKALFIGLVLLPVIYLLSMAWAWRHRSAIRAKSGAAGRFSLWFPLLTTLAAAVVILYLVPTLIGTPIGNITLFQPDLGAALIATAVTGVLWALFRLGVAYTGGPARPGGRTRRAGPPGRVRRSGSGRHAPTVMTAFPVSVPASIDSMARGTSSRVNRRPTGAVTVPLGEVLGDCLDGVERLAAHEERESLLDER